VLQTIGRISSSGKHQSCFQGPSTDCTGATQLFQINLSYLRFNFNHLNKISSATSRLIDWVTGDCRLLKLMHKIVTEYFVFMYENRMMKPVEIVLRRGVGDRE
jgi:hypothetical protein